MEEIWKDVIGYEGLYKVSNLGRVKSLARKVNNGRGVYTRPEKILSQIRVTGGYVSVVLTKDSNSVLTLLHRIVASAFIPNDSCKRTVNHKNGIKTDNRASNLEWATDGENISHSYRVLHRSPNKPWLGIVGKNALSKPVAQIDVVSGEIIASFGSAGEASLVTEVKQRAINSCATGKQKQAGGFYWKRI